MKKHKKILYSLLIVFLIFLTVFIVYWFITPNPTWLVQKAKQQSFAWVIYDRNGKTIFHDDHPVYMPLTEIPKTIRDLVVFFEDGNFYQTPGFDLPSIITRIAKWEGGGSGLEMQLVRYWTGRRDSTLDRKLTEMMLGLKMNVVLSKAQILETYLNIASFAGPCGIYNAAEYYFGKTPAQLALNEIVYLVAVLPGRKDANGRFYRYVRRLQSAHIIDEQLFIPTLRLHISNVPYSGVYVDHCLDEIYGTPNIKFDLRDGLAIYTTLDKELNDRIGQLISQEEYYAARNGSILHVSFLLTNQDGEVLSYIVRGSNRIGSYDDLFSKSSLPASRFKVVVYGLWINKLIGEGKKNGFENIQLPLIFKYPNSRKVVRDRYKGKMALAAIAVAHSFNAPPLYIANEVVGLKPVIDFCRLYEVHLKQYPSLALGAQNIRESDLLRFFMTFIGDGQIHDLRFIKSAENEETGEMYVADNLPLHIQVIDPAVPQIMRGLLSNALEGTSKGLLKSDIIKTDLKNGSLKIYNKTGTGNWNQFGCTGAFSWKNNRIFFYTLKVEALTKKYNASADVAVPILKDIIEVAIKTL